MAGIYFQSVRVSASAESLRGEAIFVGAMRYAVGHFFYLLVQFFWVLFVIGASFAFWAYIIEAQRTNLLASGQVACGLLIFSFIVYAWVYRLSLPHSGPIHSDFMSIVFARWKLVLSSFLRPFRWLAFPLLLLSVAVLAVTIEPRLLSGNMEDLIVVVPRLMFNPVFLTVVFVAAVISVGGTLFLNYSMVPGERATFLVQIVSAFLTVGATTFALYPKLNGDCTGCISQAFTEFHLISSPKSDAAHQGDEGEGEAAPNRDSDSGNALNILLSILSAGSFVEVVRRSLAEMLHEILGQLKFDKIQSTVARRVKMSVRSAIKSGTSLNALYPNQVEINRETLRRQFPLVTEKGGAARVRLIINENSGYGDHGPTAHWAEVAEYLNSADIDLFRSLFFVYSIGRHQHATLICYGTGSELSWLLKLNIALPGDPEGRSYKDAFTEALDSNDAPEVHRLVELARKSFLTSQPGASMLLSTVSAPDTELMLNVMSKMSQHSLQRILLVSDRAPWERGILSAAEISSFLTNS